jgi:leader peptidase (prepilin peptidase)/N-methyltransferase
VDVPAFGGPAPGPAADTRVRTAGNGPGTADLAVPGRPGLGFDATIGAAVAAPVVAVVALAHLGLGARGLIAAALCAVLVVLAAFDLDQRRIPNRIVIPTTGLILIAQLALYPGEALEWIGAGTGAGLLLFLPTLLKADAIGYGDIKLAILLGVGLGGEVLSALLYGSLATVPLAAWMLWRRGASARHETIPLAPFLAFGGIVALLVG